MKLFSLFAAAALSMVAANEGVTPEQKVEMLVNARMSTEEKCPLQSALCSSVTEWNDFVACLNEQEIAEDPDETTSEACLTQLKTMRMSPEELQARFPNNPNTLITLITLHTSHFNFNLNTSLCLLYIYTCSTLSFVTPPPP